ncbi:glycosyltransferase family 4 protein [candidate division KSB1 bacterium]
MRIGFDISAQSLPRSGVGRYQYHLLKALLDIDQSNFYHLYAFNFRNRHNFKKIKFPAKNYEINALPIPHRLITLWWMMMKMPRLDQLVGKCDVYHISEIAIQPVKNAKTTAFIHDLTTILFPEHHVKSNVFLHKKRFQNIHKTDAILTNSESTKKDIIKHLKVSPDKIFVTHLGADDSFRPMKSSDIKPVLTKYRLNKPYILFVGTLEPRKNVKTLIEAFDKLKKDHDIPHQLVLVGQKGWLYKDILKKIESSPYKNDIRHLDYVPEEDLPALMNGAEVFAYPSFYEGFGLPVLEAMQCGIPVVTSNISSMPEVGGEACLYIDPDSADDLADKIYSVVNNPKLQKSLSEKGIERAKDFSWEKCAKDTLKVYKYITQKL